MSDSGQRDPLGFVSEVVRAFEFLERDYRFERVAESAESVRYENGPIYVDVICEVGVNALFGRRREARDGVRGIWRQLRGEWGVAFPSEYLDEMNGGNQELDHGAVNDPAEVRRRVRQLADFTEKYARGVLEGDDRVYRALGAIARRRSRELTDWASGRATD